MIDALFTHTRLPEEVAARIAALDDAGREAAAKEFVATTSKLRTRLVGRDQAQSFLVLLAHLPITPAQAAKALNRELLEMRHAPIITEGLRAKGGDWMAAFIRSASAVPRLRADLARLVRPLPPAPPRDPLAATLPHGLLRSRAVRPRPEDRRAAHRPRRLEAAGE